MTHPIVRITRVRFLEDDIYEGDFPRDDTRTEDFEIEEDSTAETIASAIAVLNREGLTFGASGSDWAANPDGTVIVDYGTGEREETTAHLIGFTEDETIAIMDGAW